MVATTAVDGSIHRHKVHDVAVGVILGATPPRFRESVLNVHARSRATAWHCHFVFGIDVPNVAIVANVGVAKCTPSAGRAVRDFVVTLYDGIELRLESRLFLSDTSILVALWNFS